MTQRSNSAGLKDVGKQLGADELEAMRAVRRLFDPQGILNPGKGY